MNTQESQANYNEYTIPEELRSFMFDGNPDLSPETIEKLRIFVNDIYAMNKELMSENAKLGDEQSEWLQKVSESEEKVIELQTRYEIEKKASNEAIIAGTILAEEIDHVKEVNRNLSRHCFGRKSETGKKPEEESVPNQSDDVSNEGGQTTDDVKKSIQFFQSKVKEIAEEEKQSASKSKKKSKKKTKNADTLESDAPEAGGKSFQEMDPEDLYGMAQGKSFEEIEEDLKNSAKQVGNATVKPEELDEYKKKWARVTKNHFGKMLENCKHCYRVIDSTGKFLPEDVQPENEIVLDGYTLRLVGLKEVHREIGAPEIILPVIHEMQCIYRLSLNGTERSEEILRAQEALRKYGIIVDGAKKAERELAESILPESTADKDIKPETSPASGAPDVQEESLENLVTDPGQDPEKKALNIEKESEEVIAEMGEEPNQTVTETEEDQEREAERKREEKRTRERERQRAKAAKKREEAGKPPKPEKRKATRMETFVHSEKKTTSLIPRSIWSPGFAALVLTIMFGLVVPGYRLATAGSFLLGGINIPTSTIGFLSILIYERKLSYLMPYLQEALTEQKYMHADETPLKVLRVPDKGKGFMSYVWIYASMACSPVQIRIFDYEPGRAGIFARNFLGCFTGVLLTDAYQGYNLVDNVIHAFCFIHFRRKIFEALVSGSNYYVRSKAQLALNIIDMIFEIEDELQGKGLTAQALADARQKEIYPKIQYLNRLLSIIDQDKHISKKSKLSEAVRYYMNHYTELTYFLKDGNVPMHNQVAELGARAVALHRNNSFFWGSPRGAKAFCAILSFVETAKANNLDLYKYFLFLFENMRGNDFCKDPEFLKSLLPFSDRAKAECSSNRPKKTRKVKIKGGQVAA